MILRPRALRPGDLVELVGTSGAVRPGGAEAAVAVLTGWGLRVRISQHALGRWTYLSGTDEERLADLNGALRDPEVRGVICLRGGYGMQRIVDDVDYDAVRADPKLVTGFSDITALLVALHAETGLASVHGPTASQFDKGAESTTLRSVRRALMSGDPVTLTADHEQGTFPVRAPGRASGTLIGGNLAMLGATVGTRHAPDLTGAILLLEDLNEYPYRIDRALTHLRRAGWLGDLAAVAVGQFTDCVDEGPTVEEVLQERLGSLGVPVLGGLPVGHDAHQVAVGIGVPAVLDVAAGTLTVEAATR